MYRVALVCLGNICRSPIADVVVNAALRDAGLDDRIEVTSCGTGTWHVGEPMDGRAAAVLTALGYAASRHRAKHIGADWFVFVFFLVLVWVFLVVVLVVLLPVWLVWVRKFRSYDPLVGPDVDPDDVPDLPAPFYGGPEGFDDVLAIVERTSRELVRALGLVR